MVDTTFERLTSARLILRRFRADDIETFVRYRADPAIARFQSWENFSDADGHEFFASLSRQHPDTPGEWFQFAIELMATRAMIGDCALHVLAESPREVEIGFTLAPEFHGHGYASEAVSCLLDYVFGALGKERATAITDARNTASIAVLERLGFARDPAPREPILFKGEQCHEYLYHLRRKRHPCPCCGYLTFDEPPGSYGICKICFWEDDAVQLRFPELAGGANKVSLIEAQRNYGTLGASEERFRENVRLPIPSDARDPTWRPLDPARDIFERADNIGSGSDYIDADSETDDMDPASLYYWRRPTS